MGGCKWNMKKEECNAIPCKNDTQEDCESDEDGCVWKEKKEGKGRCKKKCCRDNKSQEDCANDEECEWKSKNDKGKCKKKKEVLACGQITKGKKMQDGRVQLGQGQQG